MQYIINEKSNQDFLYRLSNFDFLHQYDFLKMLIMMMLKNLMEIHYDVYEYVNEDYMIMKISLNNIDIEMVFDLYG